jgi:hypothetical protein
MWMSRPMAALPVFARNARKRYRDLQEKSAMRRQAARAWSRFPVIALMLLLAASPACVRKVTRGVPSMAAVARPPNDRFTTRQSDAGAPGRPHQMPVGPALRRNNHSDPTQPAHPSFADSVRPTIGTVSSHGVATVGTTSTVVITTTRPTSAETRAPQASLDHDPSGRTLEARGASRARRRLVWSSLAALALLAAVLWGPRLGRRRGLR